jgi:hypothetical protein
MTHPTFFSQYGRITDPGPYADLYAGLPDEVSSLVQVVQGLMVHVFWAERYGLKLSEDAMSGRTLALLPRKPGASPRKPGTRQC